MPSHSSRQARDRGFTGAILGYATAVGRSLLSDRWSEVVNCSIMVGLGIDLLPRPISVHFPNFQGVTLVL